MTAEELKAKVVLVGAPGVGKTSLVRRYVLNEFSENYRMTLGALVYKREEQVLFESRTVAVTMTVWDTMGGSDSTDPLGEVYLSGVQGVLAVCDVTERQSIPPMKLSLDAAVGIAGDVPVQILLNKADLGPNLEAQYAGLTTGLDRAAPCWLTSAKQGDNVAASFQQLARRIVEGHFVPPHGPLDGIDEAITLHLESAQRTTEEVARNQRIAQIVADARLERLRRRGFVRLATLTLDDVGRPQATYARTDRPIAEVLTSRLRIS